MNHFSVLEIIILSAFIPCLLSLLVKTGKLGESERVFIYKKSFLYLVTFLFFLSLYVLLCFKKDLSLVSHLFAVLFTFSVFMKYVMMKTKIYLGSNYIQKIGVFDNVKINFSDVEKIIIRISKAKTFLTLKGSSSSFSINSEISGFDDVKCILQNIEGVEVVDLS